MTNFKVPTRDQVTPEAQGIFDQLKSQIGMVPNIYAYLGNSANGLSSYLSFDGAIGKGSFTNKEKEAIKLAASEVNGCIYCLSAHTAIAKMNGFSEDETIALRSGTISDTRLNALVNLTKEITQNRGKASSEAIERFFNAGYNEQAIADLILIIGSISVTNYLHNLTEIPVDFPQAPALETFSLS